MFPSFQIKVVFAFHLSIRSLGEEWRGTECKLQSVMIWGPCHLLVLLNCLLSSQSNLIEILTSFSSRMSIFLSIYKKESAALHCYVHTLCSIVVPWRKIFIIYFSTNLQNHWWYKCHGAGCLILGLLFWQLFCTTQLFCQVNIKKCRYIYIFPMPGSLQLLNTFFLLKNL